MSPEPSTPICYVNGKRYELPQGRAEATLLQWLRGNLQLGLLVSCLSCQYEHSISCKHTHNEHHRVSAQRASSHLCFCATAETHLTGTKLGCAEGGCGACTVMVSHQATTKLVHRSVNACLCPLYAVEGMHIVTVEGVVTLAWCCESYSMMQLVLHAICISFI